MEKCEDNGINICQGKKNNQKTETLKAIPKNFTLEELELTTIREHVNINDEVTRTAE